MNEIDIFDNYDSLIEPDNWWLYTTPPLGEQIEVVNKICQVLNIDFPICSQQFTKASYSWFIKKHACEYKNKLHDWLETHDFVNDAERLGI